MSTSLSGIDLPIVIAYVVSLLAYGLYRARKVKTSEDFLVAGRSVGVIGLTSTLVMAELNSATLVAFAGIGYSEGFYAMALPFFVFSGPFLVYAFTVAKKWKRLNAVSVNALFFQRYGGTTLLLTKTSATETAMRVAFYERVGPPLIGQKQYLAAKAAIGLETEPPAGH